jgi:hypothetical protein
MPNAEWQSKGQRAKGRGQKSEGSDQRARCKGRTALLIPTELGAQIRPDRGYTLAYAIPKDQQFPFFLLIDDLGDIRVLDTLAVKSGLFGDQSGQHFINRKKRPKKEDLTIFDRRFQN